MKTLNFILTEVRPEDCTFLMQKIIDRYPYNYTYHPEDDKFYKVSDHGCIGMKHLAHFKKKSNSMETLSFYKPFPEVAHELYLALKELHPEISGDETDTYLRPCLPGSFDPDLEDNLIRNEKLQETLSSFSWLESANLIFEDGWLLFESLKPALSYNFYATGAQSLTPESLKSLFVEHEIKEHEFYQLRELFISLYDKNKYSVSNILFTYTKTEGLK